MSLDKDIKYLVYINNKSYNIHDNEESARDQMHLLLDKSKHKYDEFNVILELDSEILCRTKKYIWLGLKEDISTLKIGFGKIKKLKGQHKYKNISVPTNVNFNLLE